MIAKFEMTDLGEFHYFLGIEVWQKEDGIFMSQAKYTWDILKKFRMLSCKPTATPLDVGLKLYKHDDSNSVDVTLYHQLVGSLIYLTTTQPDISLESVWKSTSGYSFSMGSTKIAWSTNKKPIVSLSTTEAKYKAATREAVWLRRILEDLHEQQEKPTQLMCDNKSVIQMTKNPIFHKNKHIDIQCHFAWDLVQLGVIEIKYCKTDE
eukprot:PITA_26427